MTNLMKLFKRARNCGTPLVAIRTPDQAMTIQAIKEAVTNGTSPAIIAWDCVRGFVWQNEEGLEACFRHVSRKATGVPLPKEATETDTYRVELGRATVNIVGALELAMRLPEGDHPDLHEHAGAVG